MTLGSGRVSAVPLVAARIAREDGGPGPGRRWRDKSGKINFLHLDLARTVEWHTC
jgi:hypothetical protein